MAELPFKRIKSSSSPRDAPISLLLRDKSLDAKGVKYFVLDKCDKMLEQLG
jgi:hypothetical protein